MSTWHLGRAHRSTRLAYLAVRRQVLEMLEARPPRNVARPVRLFLCERSTYAITQARWRKPGGTRPCGAIRGEASTQDEQRSRAHGQGRGGEGEATCVVYPL
jgi:hypothetical protein